MLIDIQYRRYLGYDEKTKLYSYEFELTDSEFGSVAGVATGMARPVRVAGVVGAVIAEYGKRNLNVAANLIKLLLLYKQQHGWEIASQIDWWQKHQPLFTAKLKAQLDKLLTLI